MFVTLNLIKGPLRRSPCIVTVKPGFFLLPAGLRMVTYPWPLQSSSSDDAKIKRFRCDFQCHWNGGGGKTHRVKIVIIGAGVNSTVRSDRWR